MELWRTVSDSSDLTSPQVLVRRLVATDRFEPTIAFYEGLLGQACGLRFTYPEVGLALGSVSSVLIIAGDDASLAPFRATDYTALVASLETDSVRAVALGAEIVEAPKDVPTGRNMLLRHPDGSLVEYVEHRPQEGEST